MIGVFGCDGWMGFDKEKPVTASADPDAGPGSFSFLVYRNTRRSFLANRLVHTQIL